jgi:hypothetical protein
MSDDGNSTEIKRSTLKALVDELRGRCEAICRIQGGPTYYGEEVAIFSEVAEERKLFLGNSGAELDRPPDDEGNEHQVWFIEDRTAVLKATWPDFFGKLVIYSSSDNPNASPIGYLERWHLHNEIFGDSVEFVGALKTEEGLRLIIRQPAIAGTPATESQIREFFETTGWQPFMIGNDLAFFDPSTGIAVSDTHPGNLILMSDGNFAPIDLRVQKLTPTLVDAVKGMLIS